MLTRNPAEPEATQIQNGCLGSKLWGRREGSGERPAGGIGIPRPEELGGKDWGLQGRRLFKIQNSVGQILVASIFGIFVKCMGRKIALFVVKIGINPLKGSLKNPERIGEN